MARAIRFGSVCSGIEAASCAWHPLGWESVFNSEIEPFPRAVLEHHYPDVPLHGDFTTIEADTYGSIDLLVGGTPCQSFSIAGLRKGLDDDRGNLALEFLKLADRTRPTWIVWENVPGVLSSSGGRDFGSFLGALVELGYGFAYRVLDAQYFGVPQRRRRVFVVGYLGDWRPPAAVLFERESMRGNPAPSREKREVAPTIPSRSTGGGGLGTDFDCDGGLIKVAVMSSGQANAEIDIDKSSSLNCNRDGAPIVFKASHYTRGKDGAPSEVTPPLSADADKGDQDALVFQPRYARNGRGAPDTIAAPLTAEAGRTGKGDSAQCVAFAQNTRDEVREMPYAGALAAQPGTKQQSYIRNNMQVRRLTPIECERLQGFPDNYTRIPWRGKAPEDCPDGPRYKALGNSMAVPCMRWIGERINLVEEIINEVTQ